MADLAAIDPAGVVHALGIDDARTRADAVGGLLDRARAAATALAGDGTADELAGRLAAATGLPVPVAPRFAVPGGLADAFAAGADRVPGEQAIPAWLLAVGRVHPGVGALGEAISLLELAARAPRAGYGLAQLPNVPGEPWAAVARPLRGGPEPGRTCLVTITDWQRAVAGSTLSGLLFDAWTEPIPAPDLMTGVAVHFDSPSARPPQAVLLVTVPPETGFDVDQVVLTVRQTLDMARCRSVGPETLDHLGHLLPGLFLPAGSEVSVTAVAP